MSPDDPYAQAEPPARLADPYTNPELSDTEAAELKTQISQATGIPAKFFNGTTESELRESADTLAAWKQKGGWWEQYKRNLTPTQKLQLAERERQRNRVKAADSISDFIFTERVNRVRNLRTDEPPKPVTNYKIH